MVLGGQPPGRVGRRRLFLRKGAARAALFSIAGRFALDAIAPGGIELAQPAHALRDRRMRDEQAAEPVLGEGVDREQRLGGRASLERDELGRLLEPQQRVGEAVRRVAELRRVAGRRRTRASARRAGGRTPPRSARGRRGAPAGASRRSGSSRGAARRRRRPPSAPACRGAARARSRARAHPRARPAGRRRRSRCSGRRRSCARRVRSPPRSGCPSRNQVEPRLRDSGARREPLDRRVEERRLADRHLSRADHPERDAVERPVRAERDEEQRAEDEDREPAHAVEQPADERDHAGERQRRAARS